MKKRWLLRLVILLLVISPKIWALGDKAGIIAYVSYNRITKTGDICLINEKGHSRRNLTALRGGDNTTPVWSPNGKRIAFLSNRDEGGRIYYPYVMDANGRNQRCLTSIRVIDYLSWSPDGKRITFAGQSNTKDKDWNWEIYVINADGKNLRRLTRNKVDDRSPTWAPNGKKIAFVHYKHFRKTNIPPTSATCTLCLIDPDGSNLVSLIDFKSTSGRIIYFPNSYPPVGFPLQWTTDSKRIVLPFTRNYNCKECNKLGAGIGVFEIKDKKIKSLNNSKCCNTAPHLSPDGKRVYFIGVEESKGYKQYLVSSNGQGLNKLQLSGRTQGQGFSGCANWSPDNKKIAYVRVVFHTIFKRRSRYRFPKADYSAVIYVVNLEKRSSLQTRYGVKELMSFEKEIANILPAWCPAK